MAPNDVKTEALLKQLIKLITHFNESDRNFQICLNFALSNIKHHRFLDINESKIQQSCERIYDKLILHSQQEKANHLRQYVKKYLDYSLTSNESSSLIPSSRFAVLSLLLNLAVSPTKSIIDVPVKVEQNDEEESFDWAAYLLEGEQDIICSNSDEDEHEDEHEGDRNVDIDVCANEAAFVETSGDKPSVLTDCQEQLVSSSGYGWLQQNTMLPYWLGTSSSCVACTQHRECNLAVDWEAYLAQVNPLHVRQRKLCLTEYRIIREVLWTLMGSQESTLFSWNENKYTVNDRLELAHVTAPVLGNILADIAHYATMVRKLRHFVERTVASSFPVEDVLDDSQGKSSTGLESVQIPFTYQAFAAELSLRLHFHRQFLCAIEKQVLAQDQTFTMLQLLTELRPHFEELATLYAVYENGIRPYLCVTCSNVERACRLLGTLHEYLVQTDSIGEKDKTKVTLLLTFWIKSCKPYLDIIDEWMTHGNLVDSSSEFIISRSSSRKVRDESFWNQTFAVQPVVPTVDSAVFATDVEDLSPAEGNVSFSAAISWMPQFLAPVTAQIMRAGKSLELLQSLGRLRLEQYAGHKSFFDQLVTHINSYNSEQGTDSSSYPSQNIANETLVNELDSDNVVHTRLAKSMEHLFANKQTSHMYDNNFNLQPFRGHLPILEVLQQALYPPILARYEEICKHLMAVLQQDYHLLETLADIRKFFLMEAGDAMHSFYSQLFAKRQQLGDAWQDASFLNIALQDAVHPTYPKQAKRLFASVTDSDHKSAKRSLISSFEPLILHYNVTWPINMVLSSKCMEIYNKIFAFLLQIKWAKYALEQLDFEDLHRYIEARKQALKDQSEGYGGDGDAALEHRMHLMRSRMLYFINSLHSYITFRILHTTGLEFNDDLSSAHDLDEVMYVHNRYITCLYERCLLQRKVHLLKEVMLKAMNFSLQFHQLWGANVVNMRMEQLTHLDSEFAACMQFLRSFLNNVIKRGSFPHLESLAVSLESAR